jgi:hypothetical protein
MYLATMHIKMTPQELFNEIGKGFEAGNFPSKEGGTCLYRSRFNDSTLKYEKCCLAGMFIPDDEYNQGLENRPAHRVDHICQNSPKFCFEKRKTNFFNPDFSLHSNEDLPFIQKLQNVHDSHDWTKPETFMSAVAAAFKEYGHEIIA